MWRHNVREQVSITCLQVIIFRARASVSGHSSPPELSVLLAGKKSQKRQSLVTCALIPRLSSKPVLHSCTSYVLLDRITWCVLVSSRCQKCGLVFNRKDALTRHVKICGEVQSEVRFVWSKLLIDETNSISCVDCFFLNKTNASLYFLFRAPDPESIVRPVEVSFSSFHYRDII